MSSGKMTAQQEKKFIEKSNNEFKGHRGLRSGRDYRWNVYRHISQEDRDNYRNNFDTIFPNAPGAGI